MKKSIKRSIVAFLVVCMVFSLDFSSVSFAEENDAVLSAQDVIELVPFENQWKYYGQERTLKYAENYRLSEDCSDVSLVVKPESEEIGKHAYTVSGTAVTADAQKTVNVVVPTGCAITYEIKEYKTDEQAVGPTGIINSTEPYALEAPEGYEISKDYKDVKGFSKELIVTNLIEGENVVEYYLRSVKSDATYGAIDQTKKTIKIVVDITPPVLTYVSGGDSTTDESCKGYISGTEDGKYYYVCYPEDYGLTAEKELTQETIKSAVASKYGIVGFGRIDKQYTSDFEITGLMPETNYVVYAFMEDAAGNKSQIMKSAPFATDKMGLLGTVNVSGAVEVDKILTATPVISSYGVGNIKYQWYRIKIDSDMESFETVFDETGGAAEDDLEADVDDENEDEDDDDDDDDVIDVQNFKILTSDDYEDYSIGATPIEGATSNTYKITKSDIGCRIVCVVECENYSGSISGRTDTFVPKLMPEYKLPGIAAREYCPTLTLSKIALPENWSWVDNTIVPVYKNSGYRAKFVPKDNNTYKTIVVRVPVPISKRALKKSMVKIGKSYEYRAKPITGNFVISDLGFDLKIKKDYKVTYYNNQGVGTAKIKFKGVGNYKNSFTINFKIRKKKLSNCRFFYKKQKVVNKKGVTANLLVKNGFEKMEKGKDYTAKYSNNKAVGKAKITIVGKGNYYGKKVLSFSVIPPKPRILSLMKNKKTVTLNMKGTKETKGYYVFVSTSKKFKKKTTDKYVVFTDRFGLSDLKKKTTYYFKIKAYQVTKGGNKYLSTYSSIKKVNIK